MFRFVQHIRKFAIDHSMLFKSIVVIFYLVGIAGSFTGQFRETIFSITPWVLLLNFLLLMLFHEPGFTKQTFWVFLSVFLFGLTIEMIGVATHVVFGHYYYGNNLGIKLFDTPIIIGLNWLFLVYISSSLIERFKLGAILHVLVGSVIMLVYDYILEKVASVIDMWHWQNNLVPLRNYFTWFVLAIVFHSLFKILNIKTKNRMAAIMLICQFSFLVLALIST